MGRTKRRRGGRVMDFWTWLESCPVKYEVDSLQGFDGVSVAFYPPREEEDEENE
jgi:hypothetical protein